ncbi:hypothetical protein [uncultured Chryseobacterium sp.]|jgi:hypothetical protein|uniref:hypothetical protein n=1 Tax=uncultured Chryseobacterium sp. TaxID=259322 RepID=UPI002603239F|nr:hypothetical protein [uncultured Chryseobacterium sp.]
MSKKLVAVIQKNKGSFILRDLEKLFSANESLPDYRDFNIKASSQNGSGIYTSKRFYKKISKF